MKRTSLALRPDQAALIKTSFDAMWPVHRNIADLLSTSD